MISLSLKRVDCKFVYFKKVILHKRSGSIRSRKSNFLFVNNIILFEIQYPGKKGKNIEDFPEVPAYLRVMIWFGLEEDQMDWTKRDDVEGDFSVFAETVSFWVDFSTLWNLQHAKNYCFIS